MVNCNKHEIMVFKHAFSLQCLFRNISIGCNRNFTSRDLLSASMKDAENPYPGTYNRF